MAHPEVECTLEYAPEKKVSKLLKSPLLKSPWLEINIMLAVLVLSYIALGLISAGLETPPGGMSAWTITGVLFGFFFLSFGIALVAVIAGIGGGGFVHPVYVGFHIR